MRAEARLPTYVDLMGASVAIFASVFIEAISGLRVTGSGYSGGSICFAYSRSGCRGVSTNCNSKFRGAIVARMWGGHANAPHVVARWDHVIQVESKAPAAL